MREDESLFFDTGLLETIEAAVQSIAWIRDDCRDLGQRQPPLPENILKLVPCRIVITETREEQQASIGHVKVTDADGGVLFEQSYAMQ